MLYGQELFNLKRLAIRYRKKGYSYSLINIRLGIAKSTLSGWLKNVSYVPNRQVLKRIKEAKQKSREILKLRKALALEEIRKLAGKEIGNLSKRDLLMLGVGLYIGEGSKGKGEMVRIVNSDPKVIRLAIKWFRQTCGLDQDNFSLRIHLYPDNEIDECLRYWSKVTAIPLQQFGKTYIDRRPGKSFKNARRLPYGTAHLTVRANGRREFGVYLFRKIAAWIEAVENETAAGMV